MGTTVFEMLTPKQKAQHLSAELSRVINRIRKSAGGINRRSIASTEEIKAAEANVDQVCRDVLANRAAYGAFETALGVYEETWKLQINQERAKRNCRK